MKKIYFYYIFSIVVLLLSQTAAAQSFSTDTLVYNITGGNYVSVKGFDPKFKLPTGAKDAPTFYLQIPDTVNYNGTAYIVESIEDNAFTGALINTLGLGHTITSIGKNAFKGATTTRLTIPNSVIFMGENCFEGCSKLGKPRGNEINDINTGLSLGIIPKATFKDCTEIQYVTLGPELTFISDEAFSGCNKLEEITVTRKVSRIGDKAFSGCSNMKRVILGVGVETLGSNVFEGCDTLKEIIIRSPKLIESPTPAISGATIYVNSDLLDDYENSAVWGYGNTILPLEPLQLNVTYWTYDSDGNEVSGDNVPSVISLPLKTKKNIRARLSGQDFIGPYSHANHDYVTTWTSSDPSVAFMDENHYLQAVGLGSTTITASTVYDYVTYTKKFEVLVAYAEPKEVSITIDSNNPVRSDTISLGTELQLRAKILPEGAAQLFDWTSLTPNIATIDEYGKLIPRSVGRAEIKVSASLNPENIYKTQFIEVCYALPTSIDIEGPDTLRIAEDDNLTYIVNPYPYASQDVMWLTSDSTLATVSQTGNLVRVLCHQVGNVVIAAMSTHDKHIIGTKELYVNYSEPMFMSIETTVIDMKVGDKIPIQFTVLPSTAEHKAVWSSSDESIAVVDEDGYITALGVGAVTITGTAGSVNPVKASCGVYVDYADPTSVFLNYTGMNIFMGDDYQLKAVVYPPGANQEVIWTSDKENIATVDKNGLVHGKLPGATHVLARASGNQAVWGGCNIIVMPRENDYGDDRDHNDEDWGDWGGWDDNYDDDDDENNGGSNAINGVASDKFTTELHSSSITIHGLAPAQTVTIFDINGNCVFKSVAPSDGVVQTGIMNKGIYIVRIGKYTIKVKI